MSDALERAVTRAAWKARQQEVRDLHSEIAALKAERDKYKDLADRWLAESDLRLQSEQKLIAERDALLDANNRMAKDREWQAYEITKLRAALEEIVEYNRGDVFSPEGEMARRALEGK